MPNVKKVALGMRITAGPFGGGNQFGQAISHFLQKRGITVVHALQDPDIDVVLVTETRPWLASCAFTMADALRYQHRRRIPILLRVNECDERKERRLKLLNRVITQTGQAADRVIFISHWLQDLFVRRDARMSATSVVIPNGADRTIFNHAGYTPWDHQQPLKLVTHHWGANWHKGFDVYQHLDRLIGSRYKNRLSFTYIGNIPPGISLSHAHCLPPLTGSALAHEIKKNHVYITATVNEPAGMHHIEGALCGLPLLYRASGALPEYCGSYGVSFENHHDFERALEEMMRQYDQLQTRISHYPFTAEKMCQAYFDLLQEAHARGRRTADHLPPAVPLLTPLLWFYERAG